MLKGNKKTLIHIESC